MKDEKKFNYYEFFGTPDMDFDGDIDEMDEMMYDDYCRECMERDKITYKDEDDIDEDGEYIDDLEERELREMMGLDDDYDDDYDDEEEDGDEDEYEEYDEYEEDSDEEGDDEEYIEDDEDDDLSDDNDSDTDNDGEDCGEEVEEEVEEEIDERQAKIEKRLSMAQWVIENLMEEGVKSKEDKLRLERCKFIVDNLSIASKYCDHHYGFEIIEAVVNEYPLPTEFLQYYDFAGMGIYTFLDKLVDYDVDLTIKVCVWVFLHFSQYKQYDTDGFENWVKDMFNHSRCENEEYIEKMLNFLGDSYDFLLEIIADMNKVFDNDLICAAIKFKRFKLAKDLCGAILSNKRTKLAACERELDGVVEYITDEIDEVGKEGLTFLEEDLLPMAKAKNSTILNKKILQWEKLIVECKEDLIGKIAKEEGDSSAESDFRRITNSEILAIHEEQARIIAEYKEHGEYIELEPDEPKFFDYAFRENANCYAVLCKKILEPYGEFKPLDNGYIVGKMPANDLHMVYLLVSTNSTLYEYGNWGNSKFPEYDEPCQINEPIVEFLRRHVRPVKLMLLEKRAERIAHAEYYYNEIFIQVRKIWRGSELKVREQAQEMYLDYKERGLVSHAYVHERELYKEIQRRYPDAKYAYRAKWLGDRLVDIFIPSKQIAVIYNRKVPELVSPEEVEAGNKYIAELEQICKEMNVKLVVWRYHDPISKDAVLDVIG